VTKENGELSIDFTQAKAIKALNAALLKYYYNIKFWDIPDGYLCPPIPGRSDYLHYINDLLKSELPTNNKRHYLGLDIGTGANLIYPLLAKQLFGWKMVGTDISNSSLQWAKMLLEANPSLKSSIKLRKQHNTQDIFEGVVGPHDYFDFCMCNPPFHSSAQAAQQGTLKKSRNLSRHRNKRGSVSFATQRVNDNKTPNTGLNFAGKSNELWCEGGELAFIKQMLHESKNVQSQVKWFTCLVSKKETLSALKKSISRLNAGDVKIINMGQGQKISRFLAWSFK